MLKFISIGSAIMATVKKSQSAQNGREKATKCFTTGPSKYIENAKISKVNRHLYVTQPRKTSQKSCINNR